MANALIREAKKLPDGRVVVEDVPMLAEEREDDPRFLRERAFRNKLSGRAGLARPRDKKWLQRCFQILRERVESGYRLPLTFRHSDEKPELAGEFVPRRVGLAAANPGEEPRPTIFVDRYYKDEAAYRRAKKEFPYTSPEISPDYPDEVDALSLLGEAPYNKFAVPELREMFRGASPFYRSRRGLVAQVWRGSRLAEKQSTQAPKALMYDASQPRAESGEWGSGSGSGKSSGGASSGGASSGKSETKAQRKARQAQALGLDVAGNAKKIQSERESMVRAKNDMQSTAVAGSALGARGLGDGKEKSTMADVGVAEAPKVDAAAGIDVAPAGSTTEMTMQGLGEKLDKLIELHTKAHGEMMSCMKSLVEGGKPETMATADADSEGAEGMADTQADPPPTDEDGPSADPAVYRTLKVLRTELSRQRTARESDAKTLATLNGEVLGLRKTQDALKAREAHQSLVTSATNRLVALGFDLTPADRTAVEDAAKAGKSSVDALLAGYARAAEHAGPALPAYGLAEAEERADLPEDMPKELAELIAKGGEVGKAAKDTYRSWQAMSPKERQGYGGSLEGLLYDYDPTGNRIPVGRVAKGRG